MEGLQAPFNSRSLGRAGNIKKKGNIFQIFIAKVCLVCAAWEI